MPKKLRGEDGYVNLDKFTQRGSIGNDTIFKDPKSGVYISKERSSGGAHGGSAWKLISSSGERLGTLTSTGKYLRE